MKEIDNRPDVLGKKVRDIVTGFKGVATGYVQYVTGCDQVLVAPKVDSEGKLIDGQWFDVNRIEVISSVKVELDTSNDKGADKSAPVK